MSVTLAVGIFVLTIVIFTIFTWMAARLVGKVAGVAAAQRFRDAEYIMEQGNTSIMLYESDGRLFEAAELRRETRLPVVVAPCSTGRHIGVIEDTALAAIAGGADGVMLELDPDSSGSSPGCVQALTLERVGVLMEKMRRVAEAVGREL